PQDRDPDRRDHARAARPDRGLRRPGGRGGGARAAAPPCPRAVPVLTRRRAHRDPGRGRARHPGGQDRDPGSAARGGAGRAGAAMITRYLTLVALRGAVRLAGRLLRAALNAAVLLAAAPVS